MTPRREASPKWVRVFRGGEPIADTRAAWFVWTDRPYPHYYLPRADVRMDRLAPGDVVDEGTGDLDGLVRLDFGAFDWFEEDEPVTVHPRDPYSRVDVLASSRHVEVQIDGVTVADSPQPRILFETGLPARYYLPLTDVRMDLLLPSSLETRCPYKGTANYWSVQVGGRVERDVVWTYRTPLLESIKIAGLACFYNERVDLVVDGVLQARPHTAFSPRGGA